MQDYKSIKGVYMKYYDIYDMQTDEKIGQEFAWDIIDAEVKACIHLNKGSDDLYALTTETEDINDENTRTL